MTMDVLMLRFDAPLMSFGGPAVDSYGVIQPFPALSMVCGLLGNALGYGHQDAESLQSLQHRLSVAIRRDQSGTRIQDYQTVNLGQVFMRSDRGWTTRGSLDERKGGDASSATHIRLREYRADAIYTLAIALDPTDVEPTLEQLADALEYPEHPLFIGRKACLPATRLLLGLAHADDLREALCDPRWSLQSGSFEACWPVLPGDAMNHRPITDIRDWANQIHVGERWIATGPVIVPDKEAE